MRDGAQLQKVDLFAHPQLWKLSPLPVTSTIGEIVTSSLVLKMKKQALLRIICYAPGRTGYRPTALAESQA